MFKAEELPAVDIAELPDRQLALDWLREANTQASGGWGLRLNQGVALLLARDLKISLELSGEVEELRAALKGEQLRRGKAEKLAKANSEAAQHHQARAEDLQKAVDELSLRLSVAEDAVVKQQEENGTLVHDRQELRKWIDDNQVYCEETVYQSDRVAKALYELGAMVGGQVGYADRE